MLKKFKPVTFSQYKKKPFPLKRWFFLFWSIVAVLICLGF